MKTIETLGEDFVKRHKWLLEITRFCGVAICGGCAAAVARGNANYKPNDLDLVTTQEGAIQLISAINRFMLERNVHFRIYANSRNTFVPNPAIAHFRIQASFWVPICIFVLPPEEFRYYRIKGGYMLQYSKDVRQAAEELSEKDGRERFASEEFEDLPDDNTENHQENYEDPWLNDERLSEEDEDEFIHTSEEQEREERKTLKSLQQEKLDVLEMQNEDFYKKLM